MMSFKLNGVPQVHINCKSEETSRQHYWSIIKYRNKKLKQITVKVVNPFRENMHNYVQYLASRKLPSSQPVAIHEWPLLFSVDRCTTEMKDNECISFPWYCICKTLGNNFSLATIQTLWTWTMWSWKRRMTQMNEFSIT